MNTTNCRLVKFGKLKSTEFPELSYQKQGAGNWRFIDNSTGRAVGKSYPTEKSLLASARRYAQLFGCL